MVIIEKDLKIECDDNHYILYHLKTKKELAENTEESKDVYNIYGYYMNIKNAFLAAYKWRISKKYPFKESSKDLKLDLINLRSVNNNFSEKLNLLYKPVQNLKRIVFDEYKRLQNKNLG